LGLSPHEAKRNGASRHANSMQEERAIGLGRVRDVAAASRHL